MSRSEPTANDIVRVGKVAAKYEERHTVTVNFEDRGDGLTTKELPVGTSLTLKNHSYALPDVGEHVICLFYGNGLSEGVVISTIYDKKNSPPCANEDRYYFEFEGGAHVLVDRKDKFIQIQDFEGSFILMKDGDISIQAAANIHLNSGGKAVSLKEG